MSVRIRLKRMGKVRAPFYRVVVADSRTKRDGRVIEQIGKYHPVSNPSVVEIDRDRAAYWLGVGAQPSDQVKVLLKLVGVWGEFTGVGETQSRVKYPAPKPEFVPDPNRRAVVREKARPVKEAATQD